jgi:plasmid maintenance system killer protein
MQKEGHIRENVRMPVENEWELCYRFEDGKGRAVAVAVVMIDHRRLKP